MLTLYSALQLSGRRSPRDNKPLVEPQPAQWCYSNLDQLFIWCRTELLHVRLAGLGRGWVGSDVTEACSAIPTSSWPNPPHSTLSSCSVTPPPPLGHSLPASHCPVQHSLALGAIGSVAVPMEWCRPSRWCNLLSGSQKVPYCTFTTPITSASVAMLALLAHRIGILDVLYSWFSFYQLQIF